MSLQGDRAELANAISVVEGVTGSEKRPRSIKPGCAWPLLQGLERGSATAFESTWRVVVVLPGNEEKASDWFDEHHEAIAEALEEFGYVERIEPGLVATDAADLEAMILTVRREA
jgi:hypothetical protein